ncbi:MAG: hypothetical protein FWG24_02795 [Eggerthellaceae bacterium]|nr:hypothetical protein [Eggerthellaceae bacterium]
MSKKQAKLSHATHIKRNTAGTSNELSFSVLDAAKNRADAGIGKPDKELDPGFGKIPLFAISAGVVRKKKITTPTKDDILPLASGETIIATPGVSSASMAPTLEGGSVSHATFSGLPYSSPEDEITRRKQSRRKQQALVTVFSLVMGAGLLAAGGLFVYTELTNHQRQVSFLDQSLGRIKEADEVVVTLDELVNAPAGTADTEAISKVLDLVPETYTTLDDAEALAQQASANMRTSSDKEAADQAISAIEARREMLDLGTVLLQADLALEEATPYMAQAWDRLLKADSIAREAAALVTDSTNENVLASKAKSEEALDLLYEVAYMLNELASSSIAPDLELQINYVNKRVEAMQCAIASNDAILAQDRPTAEAQNAAYNKADDEAAQLARDLPNVPTEPIALAHQTNTENLRDTYADVRLKASMADAFLRDYLGS